jgi:hypothetical protein
VNTRGDWLGAKPCSMSAEREVRVLGPVPLLLVGCRSGGEASGVLYLAVAIVVVCAAFALWPIMRVEWLLWRSMRDQIEREQRERRQLKRYFRVRGSTTEGLIYEHADTMDGPWSLCPPTGRIRVETTDRSCRISLKPEESRRLA